MSAPTKITATLSEIRAEHMQTAREVALKMKDDANDVHILRSYMTGSMAVEIYHLRKALAQLRDR